MLIENEDFERINVEKSGLEKGEYDNCRFVNCDFSNFSLNEFTFSECQFIDCNFSLSTVQATAFKDVFFKGCKLVGLDFSICNPFLFEVRFEECQLNLASFYQLKLAHTKFINCQLREVDFVLADLNKASFEGCDLLGAMFERCLLEYTDFTTAINYSLDPELNEIRKARFSREGIEGLLDKYDISIES